MTRRADAPAPLPNVARSILGQYRDAHDMPADARARVWQGIEAGDSGIAEVEPDRPPWLLWSVVAAAAAIVLGLGLHFIVPSPGQALRESAAGGQAVDQNQPTRTGGTATQRPSDPPATARETPQPATPAPSIQPPPPAAADAAAPTVQPPVRSNPPTRHARGKTEVQPPPSLAEEQKLIARAWAALKVGSHDRALAIAAEHAQRFPSGALAPERGALQAIAQCQRGDRDAAARAQTFLRTHPRTPLGRKVRAACDPGKK